jgi:hypothetical protein
MGFPICRWIVETFQVLLGVLFYPFLSNESLYLSSSEREKFRTYEEDVDLVDVKKRHYDRPMFYSRHIPNQETSSNQIANQNNAIQTSLPRPFTDQDQTRFRKGSQPGIQTFASIKASPEPRHRKQFHGNEAKSIFQDIRQTESTSEKVKEFGIKGSQPLVMLDRLSILSVAKREASLPQPQAPEADHSMKFSLAKPSNVPAELLTPSSQKSIIPPNALLPIINYNEITYVQQIGTGGFGQVWKGIWKGTPVAVKMLNPACQASNVSEKILLSFEEEVCMLARLRHPNICLLLGVCMEASHRLIVTELVSRGSLWDALRTPGLFQVACDSLYFSSLRLSVPIERWEVLLAGVGSEESDRRSRPGSDLLAQPRPADHSSRSPSPQTTFFSIYHDFIDRF